jgi:hypothetical protein
MAADDMYRISVFLVDGSVWRVQKMAQKEYRSRKVSCSFSFGARYVGDISTDYDGEVARSSEFSVRSGRELGDLARSFGWQEETAMVREGMRLDERYDTSG